MIDKASSEYSQQLETIAKHNRCWCGSNLYVAWGGYYGLNEHVLRCRNGHMNPELVRIKSDYQLWKEGILIDPYRDQNEARRTERRRRNG